MFLFFMKKNKNNLSVGKHRGPSENDDNGSSASVPNKFDIHTSSPGLSGKRRTQ